MESTAGTYERSNDGVAIRELTGRFEDCIVRTINHILLVA